jgi:hypothetical protein
MWKHLIETALPGTARKMLDLNTMPDVVKESLSPGSSSDPEEQLLQTAIAIYYFSLTGKKAPQAEGVSDDSIVEEIYETAPQPLLDLFGTLEKLETSVKQSLVNLWVDTLIRKRFILSPEIGVNLLYMCNNFPQAIKEKTLNVVGNKVLWALKYNPELNYMKILKPATSWDDATTQERKAQFRTLREMNPAGAIEMLQSSWDQEPIANKKAFLEIIKETFTMSERIFIEDLSNNEFSFKPSEKNKEKECRSILAELLLRSPGSALHKITMEFMATYKGKKARKKGLLGFLGTQDEIEFLLPEQEDDFWNASVMESLYGFETKNYDISVFKNQNQYWLSLFLKMIPMNSWCELYNSSCDQISNYFLDNSEFKIKINNDNIPIYKSSFFTNIQTFRNGELAKILINKFHVKETIPLLQHLRSEDYENHIKKNRLGLDMEILKNGPNSLNFESWSPDFSKYILSEIYQAFLNSLDIHVIETGKIISRYLNPEALSTLKGYNNKMQDNKNQDIWNRFIYEPAITILETRKTIQSYNL